MDLERELRAELVLVPGTLPEVIARLTALRNGVDAGCVVALGGLAGGTDLEVTSVVGALRLRMRSWGLAAVDVAPTQVDAWLDALVQRLARNDTLDVALRSVMGSASGWMLLADPAALEAARLSRFGARTASILSQRRLRAGPLPVSEPIRVGLGLDDEGADLDLAAGDEGAALEMAAGDEGGFAMADAGAEAVAAMADAVVEADREQPRMAEARWLQADIRGGPRFSGRPERRRLAPDTAYGVDAWIGAETTGIRAGEAFPEELLPRDGRKHRLTVVFAELGGSRRTTTGHVLLPPAGSSTRHRFHFQTGSEGEFRARVIVAYRNRVLQSALLRAPVAATATRRDRIELTIEAALRPGLTELGGRSRFGASILHNHAQDGRPSGTLLQGSQAVPFDLDGVEPLVAKITADLTAAALDPDAYGPTLDAEGDGGPPVPPREPGRPAPRRAVREPSGLQGARRDRRTDPDRGCRSQRRAPPGVRVRAAGAGRAANAVSQRPSGPPGRAVLARAPSGGRPGSCQRRLPIGVLGHEPGHRAARRGSRGGPQDG